MPESNMGNISDELLDKQDIGNAKAYLSDKFPNILDDDNVSDRCLKVIGHLLRTIRMLRNIAKSDESNGIVNSLAELQKGEVPLETPCYELPLNSDELLPRYDHNARIVDVVPSVEHRVDKFSVPDLNPMKIKQFRGGQLAFAYRKPNAGRIKT